MSSSATSSRSGMAAPASSVLSSELLFPAWPKPPEDLRRPIEVGGARGSSSSPHPVPRLRPLLVDRRPKSLFSPPPDPLRDSRNNSSPPLTPDSLLVSCWFGFADV